MNLQTLEQEFSYYKKVLAFSEWLGLTKKSPEYRNKMTDLVSAIEGMGFALLIKGEAYNFLKTVIGGSAEQTSELIQNEIRCFNAKRTAEALAKSCTTLKEVGILPQRIPYKSLIPILEGLSLEEEPLLQQMWENLLTHSAAYGGVHPSCIEIIKQLGPLEVKILDAFWEISIVPTDQMGGVYNSSHYQEYPPNILVTKKQAEIRKVIESLETKHIKTDLNAMTEAISVLAGDGIILLIGHIESRDSIINLTPKGGRFMRTVMGELQ
jgi:hypothetical protein